MADPFAKHGDVHDWRPHGGGWMLGHRSKPEDRAVACPGTGGEVEVFDLWSKMRVAASLLRRWESEGLIWSSGNDEDGMEVAFGLRVYLRSICCRRPCG